MQCYIKFKGQKPSCQCSCFYKIVFGNVVNCFLNPEETVSACTMYIVQRHLDVHAPHISLIDSALPYRPCLYLSVESFARTNPCNRLPTHNQYKTAGRCFSKYKRLETKGRRQVRYCRFQSCAWLTKSNSDYNQKPAITQLTEILKIEITLL